MEETPDEGYVLTYIVPANPLANHFTLFSTAKGMYISL